MASIHEISPGTRISFGVRPTGTLNYTYTNVIFEGLITPSMAIDLGTDIEADHASRYAAFADGTPNDPRQYSYFRITTADGNKITMGVPCIREGTLTVVATGKLTLVWDAITPADQERVMTALSSVGLTPSSSQTS